MSISRFSAIMVTIVVVSFSGAQAQLAPPERSIEGQFLPSSKPTTLKKMEVWTRAKWEAAKARWQEDHGRFSDCSSKLQAHEKSGWLSLHDQRHFLYDCMNAGRPSPFASSETVARVKAWTLLQWNAGKERWKQDHERFANCNGKLKELRQQRKLSSYDEREFLVHCISEAS